jgi:hypothetical protein
MEKNIPIDQLFKNNLSEGQEQLNLGAWANMERILDGKNPYAEEATNKKRKLVPFFLAFFILIGGLLTAGYINLSKSKSSKNKSLIVSNQPEIIQKGAVETIEPTNIPPTENHSSPTQTTSANASTSEQKNISNTEAITSTKNENNSTEKGQDQLTSKNENTSKNQLTEATEISKSKTENTVKNTNPSILKNEVQHKELTQSTTNTIDASKTKKENQKITTDNNKIANTTLKKDTIAVIEIKEKTSKNRQSKNVEYDTLGRYNKVVVSTVSNIVDQENKPLAKAPVLNPRMVILSAEEELNASKRIDFMPMQEQKNQNPIVNNTSISSIKKERATKNTPSKNAYTNSIFNKMKAFSNRMAMKKIEFFPGMSVGVNAAFINTEHNYGGFHFGVNNLIPVSNYFSILSELKLFYKNNSGYSVNDKKTSLFDHQADMNTLSSQNQTIHTTTIDSTTRKYNFRSFSTMELPIILQAHIGKFTPYIGFNLAYSFKLNTTSITKNYAVKDTVILNNSVAYTQPTNASYEFMREDFGSRFGIGYTIGGSYSLNPNLYIDLRLSNVLKDNSKTLSAREISDGIFKVPFVQFSIGYRFKKFTPNN